MGRIGLLMLMVLLCGCSRENRELSRAMEIRAGLLGASGCSFRAEVTADYGDSLYTFALDCQGDEQGAIAFRVAEPESISGIAGVIRDSGGQILYEDTSLAFSLMADDQLTPASAPWILLKTLRSGQIGSVGMEGELLHITAEDSYEDNALVVDIWLDGEDRPVQADILYAGKRILSVAVTNFTLLS